MFRKYLTLCLALALPILTAGNAMAKPKGPQQLVDAFDAAWTRVIRSGEYRSIINNFDEPIAGVIDATEYIVNQSDCLPNPDVTPFPENPKGRFKEILDNAEIRRGEVIGAPQQGGSTSDWFSGGDPNGSGHSDISAEILTAILGEIAAHYDTGPINVVSVEIPFPFNTTSALQDGIFGFRFGPPPPIGNGGPVNMPGVIVDFLDQFNAKGGESEELRRLKGRRSTCTLSSSGQFIHVPDVVDAPTINSIDDLLADSSIRICTGNLSTQFSNQYFPNNPVTTKRTADIRECYEALRDDEADVFINSLPVNPTAAQVGTTGPDLLPSVNTFVVAGTPYWTKQDDIICEPVAGPPGPPLPFGTFRECMEKDNNDE